MPNTKPPIFDRCENNQFENEVFLKLKEAENESEQNNERFSPKDVLNNIKSQLNQ